MPNCTVRYNVRLVPKIPDAQAMNAIGIFSEERTPDEVGEPGPLVSRRLHHFNGPTGSSLKELICRGTDWKMVMQERVGPLEWDSKTNHQPCHSPFEKGADAHPVSTPPSRPRAQ